MTSQQPQSSCVPLVRRLLTDPWSNSSEGGKLPRPSH